MAEQNPIQKFGVFQPIMSIVKPKDIFLLGRLVKNVSESETGCWIWQGAVNSDGYGAIKYDGTMKRVHRLVYRFCVGEIKNGLYVLHNCPGGDNPLCCNPSHLFLGTQMDNVQDCIKKGRFKIKVMPKGSKSHLSKLTESIVAEIRERAKSGEYGIQKKMEKEYGVSRATINRIVHNLSWVDCEGGFIGGDGI